MAEQTEDSGSVVNMNPLVRISLYEVLDKINVLEANTKTLDVQLSK